MMQWWKLTTFSYPCAMSDQEKDAIAGLYVSWFDTWARWNVYNKNYFYDNIDSRLNDRLFLWITFSVYQDMYWYVFGYGEGQWMQNYLSSITDIKKVYMLLPKNKKIFWVDDLVVKVDERRKWIWSLLLKKLEDEALKKHYDYVTLFTLRDEAYLVNWYLSKQYKLLWFFYDAYAAKEYLLLGKHLS